MTDAPKSGDEWPTEYPPQLPDLPDLADENRWDVENHHYNWAAAVYAQLAYEEQQKQTQILEEIRDELTGK